MYHLFISAEVIEWYTFFIAIIQLHYEPPNVTSVLELFAIYRCLFLGDWYIL